MRVKRLNLFGLVARTLPSLFPAGSHLVHAGVVVKNVPCSWGEGLQDLGFRVHFYSLLGLSTHKNVRCYPTMTQPLAFLESSGRRRRGGRPTPVLLPFEGWGGGGASWEVLQKSRVLNCGLQFFRVEKAILDGMLTVKGLKVLETYGCDIHHHETHA